MMLLPIWFLVSIFRHCGEATTPPKRRSLNTLSLMSSPETDGDSKGCGTITTGGVFSSGRGVFSSGISGESRFASSGVSSAVTESSETCQYAGFWDSAQVGALCSQIEASISGINPCPTLVDEKSETVPHWFDSLDQIILGELLGVSGSSKVFSIVSHPESAIKYQTIVTTRTVYSIATAPHPVTKDYWFLKRIEKLGIAPKAIGLSDKSEGDSCTSIKVRLNVKIASSRGQSGVLCSTRYLIMDKTGPSLHRALLTEHHSHLSLAAAFTIGLNLMNLLEKLHAEEIVHGDIHHGNVCFASSSDDFQESDDFSLKLIDFGAARFVKPTNDASIVELSRNRIAFHPMLSPFEMMGFRASFRDDFFRAIQVIATLVNGKGYFEYWEQLASQDRKALREITTSCCLSAETQFASIRGKNEAGSSLFEIPSAGFLPFRFLESEAEVVNTIRNNLEQLTELSRSLAQNEVPDYSITKSLIRDILAVL